MIGFFVAANLLSSGNVQAYDWRDYGWPAQVVLECQDHATTRLARTEDGRWAFAPAGVVQESYTVTLDLENRTVQGQDVASIRGDEGSITWEHWAGILREDSPPNPVAHYIAYPTAAEGLIVHMGADADGAGLSATQCRRIDLGADGGQPEPAPAS